MKKRQPFILFEILLALAVVAIALTPLIREPLHLLNQEYLSIEKMELQRDADSSFINTKALFYQHKIPIDKLVEGQSVKLSKKEITLQISEKRKRSFQREIILQTKKKTKESPGNLKPYLVTVKVTYYPAIKKKDSKPISFFYQIFFSFDSQSI